MFFWVEQHWLRDHHWAVVRCCTVVPCSASGMALSELDVRQQAERSERGSDLVAVRGDLDRQWEVRIFRVVLSLRREWIGMDRNIM